MTSARPLRLLIDTDIGTDDAVALLLALRSPGVAVEAITTVAGNAEVDQCVSNARYVLELCDRFVPVYRGAAEPLIRGRRRRALVHGDDGFAGMGLRPRDARAESGTAAGALVRLARQHPRELTLVTLGPLTNIALALELAPEIGSLLRGVVIMGGAVCGPGTVTARAEFNIWSDPEAAGLVFRSGLDPTLVDIQLSRGRCALTRVDIDRIKRLDTPYARFAAAMCTTSGAAPQKRARAAAGLPDAIAMAVAIAPSLITRSARHYIDVETAGELTSGETVVDSLGFLGKEPNALIVQCVDAAAYKRLLFGACIGNAETADHDGSATRA